MNSLYINLTDNVLDNDPIVSEIFIPDKSNY